MEENNEKPKSLSAKLVPNIIFVALIAIGLWFAITLLIAMKTASPATASSGAEASSATVTGQIAAGFVTGMAIGLGLGLSFAVFVGVAIPSLIGFIVNLRDAKNRVFFGASLTFTLLYGLAMLTSITGIVIAFIPMN